MRDPHGFFTRLHRRHGWAATIRILGEGRVVCVADPDWAKAMFSDPDGLSAGQAANTLEPIVGQASLLTLDGPEHLRQRRLLLARDEDGNGLTDSELRDELVTLLVAGHETTATSMAWTLDLLVHDERALNAARDAAARGDGAYLEAVGKEALRLRPVIFSSGRITQQETTGGRGTARAGGAAQCRRRAEARRPGHADSLKTRRALPAR